LPGIFLWRAVEFAMNPNSLKALGFPDSLELSKDLLRKAGKKRK
jgi:hypothetical protein